MKILEEIKQEDVTWNNSPIDNKHWTNIWIIRLYWKILKEQWKENKLIYFYSFILMVEFFTNHEFDKLYWQLMIITIYDKWYKKISQKILLIEGYSKKRQSSYHKQWIHYFLNVRLYLVFQFVYNWNDTRLCIHGSENIHLHNQCAVCIPHMAKT